MKQLDLFDQQTEFEFMTNNKTDDLDIIRNDIYDTTDIIKEDTLMESHLHNLASQSDGELMSKIAKDFLSLLEQHITASIGQGANKMYWTLFAVYLLANGNIDYDQQLLKMHAFETRMECEMVRTKVLDILPAPAFQDLRCLRTDEI